MKYLKFYELLTNFKVFPKGCISCFTGLLPHHPVVDLHPPDDILPLSNVATVLHLCPLRKGNCLTRQWNALHRLPSDVPPDPPDIEALLLQEDDPLPPRHLHPDTGGAPCCHLGGEAEMLDPLLRHPDASPHPLQTAVTLLEDPQPPHGAMKPWAHLRLTSADSSHLHTIKSSAEFHAPQNAVTTRGRDHLCIRQNSVSISVYLWHFCVPIIWCHLCHLSQTISKPSAYKKSVLQICFPWTSSSETSDSSIRLPLPVSLCQCVSTTSQESQQRFWKSISKQGLSLFADIKKKKFEIFFFFNEGWWGLMV